VVSLGESSDISNAFIDRVRRLMTSGLVVVAAGRYPDLVLSDLIDQAMLVVFA
jgi:hypothetical protein